MSNPQLSQRILASYILYALYAPHPITINPFRSALLYTFNNERDVANKIPVDGGPGQNEQLVWVLWKILKGDGSDVRRCTPILRSQTPTFRRLDLSVLVISRGHRFLLAYVQLI